MNYTNETEIKNYTTLKIGGEAKNLYLPVSVAEFVDQLKNLKSPIIIGAGSNVLVSSLGVDEAVIITKNLNGFSFEENIITCECGLKAQTLSAEAKKHGLSGIEFMIGIPGTVGGLVAMNAGAHNQNVSQVFKEAQIFDVENKKIFTLKKDDMNFSYRHSILSEKKYVLLSAKFELTFDDKEKINELMQRNTEFRKKHQPSLAQPNAGSTFKNPENDSAGRLLDLAGVKSLSCGNACVFEKHANFIINQGNASSEDVSQLMLNMKNMVKNKYNISLKPEIKFIGKKSEKEQKIWEELLNN